VAALSDRLLVFTILGYTLAMLGYLAEYTFGASGAVARTAARPARERELVGASVGAGSAPPPPPVQPARPPRDPSAAARAGKAAGFGRAAVVLTVLAVATHIGVLVTRGLAAHRVPWGNMYEFVIAVCLVGAVGWLVLLWRRPSVRPLGMYATIVLVLLLGLAATVLYTKVGPLAPALNSYWLKIHVSAAATASGIFLLGAIPAILFLIRAGYDRGKRSFPFTLGRRLPEGETLERLTFRIHAFAFPIWTFAIICGAIWAEAAWGRYWGWDPKETWAFISWVVYAGYLHARATPSVRRTVATGIAVLGWLTMMVDLFVINFVAVGMHEYTGIK
jgi:cytochrome c-type biogenesis protein CcsB